MVRQIVLDFIVLHHLRYFNEWNPYDRIELLDAELDRKLDYFDRDLAYLWIHGHVDDGKVGSL